MKTISEVLGQDNQHVDAVLVAVKDAAARNDWLAAQEGIDHFADILLRHIDAEESVLFPALEATTGRSGRATAVMRDEHDQLLFRLRQLETYATARDLAAVQEIAVLLIALLGLHHPKEERVLYPKCDRGLGNRHAEVMQALDGRLQATAAL